MECRICGNAAGNREFEAREMMYGIRDRHKYFQCRVCDCLQIQKIPDDIGNYYQNAYYSYAELKRNSKWRQFLESARDAYAISGKGLLGWALASRYPHPNGTFFEPLRGEVARDSRILDVGCGSGRLLHSFAEAGYSTLLGVDPFLEKDLVYPNGVTIRRCTIHALSGEFDLIMFHHSFEHIPDQDATLDKVRGLLSPNGWCVIRIPVVDCEAWETYGTNWVQLDAPRHFFLHSKRSIRMLAERHGLAVRSIVYDSGAFQFWGSEQYVKDIPLRDPKSYGANPRLSIFSKREIANFARRAKELNKLHSGDQAVFYLQKSS